MGLIRGGIFTVVSVLIFISFIISGLLLTLSLSLDYENIQPQLTEVLEELSHERFNLDDRIEKDFDFIEDYCQNNSEYVFNEKGHTFVIPCEIVSEGKVEIISYSIDSLVKEKYYGEYNCDFWDCFMEEELPFFFVSEKARNYWQNLLYILLGVIFVLLIGMFILIEDKTNLPIIIGILLGVSSLIVKFSAGILLKIALSPLSFLDIDTSLGLFNFLLKELNFVFVLFFVGGLIIVILGVFLKFFKIGFKISEFFSKESKKDNPKDNEKKEIKEEPDKKRKEKKSS